MFRDMLNSDMTVRFRLSDSSAIEARSYPGECGETVTLSVIATEDSVLQVGEDREGTRRAIRWWMSGRGTVLLPGAVARRRM